MVFNCSCVPSRFEEGSAALMHNTWAEVVCIHECWTASCFWFISVSLLAGVNEGVTKLVWMSVWWQFWKLHVRALGVQISSFVFDLNSCGQWFTVCVRVRLSVHLISAVGKLTCHSGYSWTCWNSSYSSRWCLLKTHQTTATCPSHSMYITHPGGTYATHTHTNAHSTTPSFFFFSLLFLKELLKL